MGYPPGKHVFLWGRIKPSFRNGIGASAGGTNPGISLKLKAFWKNPGPMPLLDKKAALELACVGTGLAGSETLRKREGAMPCGRTPRLRFILG